MYFDRFYTDEKYLIYVPCVTGVTAGLTGDILKHIS